MATLMQIEMQISLATDTERLSVP